MVPAGVRLTEAEVTAIKRIVAEHFGPEAEVRVFGSRTRPEVLGGDLDLHVLVPGPRPSMWETGPAMLDLEHELDGLAVDLVVGSAMEPPSPFHRVALGSGVRL